MSWSFKKAGRDIEALKLAVNDNVVMPDGIKREVCRRLDQTKHWWKGHLAEEGAILVDTHGHLGPDEDLWNGCSTVHISVEPIGYVEAAPVAAVGDEGFAGAPT